MKRVLVAAILFLLAGQCPASAQSVVHHGQSLRDVLQGILLAGTNGGNGYVLQTDASGNLYAVPAVATRLFDAISVTNLAVATADSSEVLNVEAYPYLKLLIKAVPRGGVNTSVRLGFQFRECMNGLADSSSAFAEYMYVAEGPRPAQRDSIAFGVADGQARLVTFSGTDTTLGGHIITGAATTPWSGEYVVRVATNRNAPANGAAAVVFHHPSGLSIPLDSIFGRQVRFAKLQIRVRNLNANSPGCDVTVKVLGFTR